MVRDAEPVVQCTLSGSESAYYLPETNLSAGTYHITATAENAGGTTASASMSFTLKAESDSPATPTDIDNPDKPGEEGKQPSRIRRFFRRSRRGSGSQEGFSITPGQALTTSHARGTKELSIYGTVALSVDSEPMDELVMGGETLDIAFDSDSFTAVLEEDVLELTAEAEGEWQLSMSALETLAKSGISALLLSSGSETIEIQTDLTLSGSSYARERAKGLVAEDFLLCLGKDEIRVHVEDRCYLLENQQLIKAGE